MALRLRKHSTRPSPSQNREGIVRQHKLSYLRIDDFPPKIRKELRSRDAEIYFRDWAVLEDMWENSPTVFKMLLYSSNTLMILDHPEKAFWMSNQEDFSVSCFRESSYVA